MPYRSPYHRIGLSQIALPFGNANIAPVAQLDRVPGYELGGRRFESFRARQSLFAFIMFSDLNLISDIIGMVGVILVLLAYFFCQIEKLPSNSILYSVANLLGSIFILFSLCFHWNLSAFCVEVVWILISIIGLRKAFYKMKRGDQM